MANEWKNIKEEFYTMALEMTVANGFNFDWTTGRRADLSYKDDAVFIIEYPVGQPFEQNVSNISKGITSFQYRERRQVMFIGRVMSALTTLEAEDIIDKNNDALDDALDDIKKRFCGEINDILCSNGTYKIEYSNAYKRALSSKGDYYPYELVVIYTIDYTETRC